MPDRGILILDEPPGPYPEICFMNTKARDKIWPLDICSISNDYFLNVLEKPFDLFLGQLKQLNFNPEKIFTAIENSTYTREIFDKKINKEWKYLRSWMQIRERKDNIWETIKYIQELLDGSSRSEKNPNNPTIVYNREWFSYTYAKILFCLLDVYHIQFSKKTP